MSFIRELQLLISYFARRQLEDVLLSRLGIPIKMRARLALSLASLKQTPSLDSLRTQQGTLLLGVS